MTAVNVPRTPPLTTRVRSPRARRRLGALGILATLLVLTACSRVTGPVPTEARTLNLYAWAEYFPDAMLRRFESETGISVNYSFLDSNDVAETTLSAGHSGFDLVTVNASPHLGRQIPKGLWLKLDKSKIPNLRNADPKILELLARVDPGNQFAVPWFWGTTGIIYNPDLVRAALPAAPFDSLGLVFDPALVARLKSCGVTVLDSWVDIMPMLARYLGQPDLSAAPQPLAEVSARFAAIRPFLKRVTTAGYYEQVARGELCVAIGYSADAMVARRRAAEAQWPVRIDFAQPREDVPVYIDSFAIPADAPHPENALRFINFAMQADVSAEAATATGFATANAAAYARLDPGLRDNTIVYPSPATRARFWLGRSYSMDETRQFARSWLRMKTGT